MQQTAPHTTTLIMRWLSSFRWQAFILAVICLIFYANTFQNGYALDDNPIIINNPSVQSGISGIPAILMGDAMENSFKQQNSNTRLEGGRYRPLSIVTFAIEQQVVGNNAPGVSNDKLLSDMHVRHMVNVLLYILSVIVLLQFLRKLISPNDSLAAFLAALLFAIHPLHTEVVANVKSRDEIMSLLFICLTFLMAFKYTSSKKIIHLISALSCFLLALLSKEYAIALVGLLPLAFFTLGKSSLKHSAIATLPYVIPLGIYISLRVIATSHSDAAVSTDILNNPYLYATGSQKAASIIAVVLDYIKLLFVPNALSCDYSFNQIPYSDFSSLKVWASIVVYGILIVMAWIFSKRQHVLGFAIALFLAFLLLVSNVLINIGAPMGERLAYHASLGFAIVLAWLISYLMNTARSQKAVQAMTGGSLLLIIVASAYITINRNKDWASDFTLFTKDVQTVPNSASANRYAGGAFIKYAEGINDERRNSGEKSSVLQVGMWYLNKALQIHPEYVDAIVNRGVGYIAQGKYDSAMADCKTVAEHYPNHSGLQYLSYNISDHYYKLALERCKVKDYNSAFPLFKKAIEASPKDPELWTFMGYAYYSNNDCVNTRYAAEQAMKLDPNNTKARKLIKMCADKETAIK
ncbi:hypothetical protein CJD36_021735 [Flavipsychrobacter stenotrophus]|uniref:Uncharacterized protein n=1 Tax=Flavipsychrobacter stenotrophus TaxID=2077091 RepID=A0A2S7SPQ6_9BACT|nr:glycosyltransferase family 39 protein [Flavipsychrobacter stenotrophus]PQJ08893.1 hypothetical protein CJD36_021735 [Flavipsychrobacter stenotrophus]